jgi:hypothetical protein
MWITGCLLNSNRELRNEFEEYEMRQTNSTKQIDKRGSHFRYEQQMAWWCEHQTAIEVNAIVEMDY